MQAMRFDIEYDETRREKAIKIVRILQDCCKKDLKALNCLDLGCAKGIITRFLKEDFRQVFGLDMDENLVREAVQLEPRGHTFAIADASQTPFPNSIFDVIVCAQVYEHTQNPQALANEIYRLLKPGGICFFSGPNRWSPIEEHYWLPFLSWFPQPLANLYLWIFRRRPVYDVRPLFYWQLRRLFRKFEIHDYTARLLCQPGRFGLNKSHFSLRIVALLPAWFYQLLILWLPNYNWVLIKKEANHP